MNNLQLSHGPGNDKLASNFRDPNTGNNMIFVFQVCRRGVGMGECGGSRGAEEGACGSCWAVTAALGE